MLTLNAPPEALLDRFLKDCRAIVPITRAHKIGVAVSGGPDSLALLLLAHGTFGNQIEAATVDHGLRAESGPEACFVAELCRNIGVAHTTLPLLRPMPHGNVSARARELRYAQLHDWAKKSALNWLMTAHHADDQLETLLMRLNRGTGAAGLAGIRRRTGIVLRPLLGWRRVELGAVVDAAGITAVDDPSNRDDAYDRARLRKALADADWLDPMAFVHSAQALDDANDALSWSAWRLAKERASKIDATWFFDVRDVPSELVRRIVLAILRELTSKVAPRGSKMTRFVATLQDGGKATLDGVVGDARDIVWRFRVAPPRRPGG